MRIHELFATDHATVFVETTSGGVATAMTTIKSPRVGTLFGGSYKPINPFVKKNPKKVKK